MTPSPITRRRFLGRSAAGLAGLWASASLPAAPAAPAAPIIDIHQHTHFGGRADDALIAHQRAMGVTTTLLLPAGRDVSLPSTHGGKSNGLAAKAHGNDSCVAIARRLPGEFLFAANEVPDLPDAPEVIARYLQMGAVAIAEVKFALECDAPALQRLYAMAGDHGVPILLHIEHGRYTMGFERFHKMLAQYPKTRFIGHATAWWAHLDLDYKDLKNNYPKGRITPGGLTDRYLSDYPNLYADYSAGSGLNALKRDPDFTRDFMARHPDQLLYGSDCNDIFGHGAGCSGSQAIAAIRRLAPSPLIERKILHDNAQKLFRLAS